jgi:Leucine-rich repeat (LRR) protein
LNLGSHGAAGPEEPPGLLQVHKLPVLLCVPEGVFALTMITTLVLKCNKISTLAGLEALVSCVSLDVSENALTELQGPTLAKMPQLTELVASENRIVEVPAEIGALTKLETLALFKNQLKSVSDEISKCVSLKEVNFFNNVLINLPAGLAECSSLEVLNVGGNKLKTLPSTDKWTQLKVC